MLPFPQSKSARIALFGVGVLLFAGSLGYVFWDDLPFIHDAPQRLAQTAQKPARPGQVPSPAVPGKPAPDALPQSPDPAGTGTVSTAAPAPAVGGDLVKTPQDTPQKPSGVFTPPAEAPGHYLTTAGNMRNLTGLLANLEEVKVRVAIEEQVARLKKLQEPVAPPVPQLIFPPSAQGAQGMPDLKQFSPPKRNRVLAIQGIDGNVAATLETGAGPRVVKVGDSFAGGKVERITSAGVLIRDGKNTQLLPVEE